MRISQVGTMSTSLTIGTSADEEMLHVQMTNTIVLLDGTLVIENEDDKPMLSGLKWIRLNLVVLAQETLYILQDGVPTEL